MTVVALAAAEPEQRFGGKAAALARTARAGLPVPEGFAISWDTVASSAAGDASAQLEIIAAYERCGGAVAVRSSAVGEDSEGSSFAGQHLTLLNVRSPERLLDAIVAIHDSVHAGSALSYREKMGVSAERRIAVVVMAMVDAEMAGVLFTRNPITGAKESTIEAAWGLGESVVSGLVSPDRFRVRPDGTILERTAGRKDAIVRYGADGGVIEEELHGATVTDLCLTDEQLLALHQLGAACEAHFGTPQDVEWAWADGRVHLLQSRPITRVGEADVTDTLTARRFTGLALAALLAPLNSTIIAVALPAVAASFQSSPALVTRCLVTAYLAVSIIAQSPAGKLTDIWGTTTVLTLGRALFGIGALLAAISSSLPVLTVGRVLMALGGALAVPTVFAALRNSVPAGSRGRVFGIFGAIMGAAAAAGPILGGFLTSKFGWHAVFLVNIPVVALSMILEPPVRTEKKEGRRAPRFDFAGSAVLAVAVVLLVAGVEKANVALLAAAAVAVLAFVTHQLRTEEPVLNVRLFMRVPFAAGSAIVALQNLAMYSMIFLLPFFLAQSGGAPRATGGMLLLFTGAMVVASPVGGRLSDAAGPRLVAVSGAIGATIGAVLFMSGGHLAAALMIMGAGIGLTTSPSQAAALGVVSPGEAGVASGALSTMRYVGGVVGAGFVAMLATSTIARDPRLVVFPAVLLLSAISALALPGRRRAREVA